jgi:predicted MPP superfamily phosphohydrolase
MRLPDSTRVLRVWLLALNIGLVAFGGVLAAGGARRGLFLVAMVPLVFLPFAYARWRLHRFVASGADRRWTWAFAATGMVFDATMIAQLLTARAADAGGWLNMQPLGWIGPVWFSAHALLFLGLAALGIVRGLRRLLRLALVRPRPAPAGGDDALVGRRAVLQQLGVLGAAAPFAVSLSGVSLSYDFRLDEHEIELPHWPRGLDGLRVAHLSDIHVGGAMDRRRLAQVAALTESARPDLIVHTGDFLTHRGGDFDAPLYEALSRLRAPYGQWACLGNHDFDDPERLERKLREAGVTLLRNRLAHIAVAGQPLEIGGLDYLFAGAQRAVLYQRILTSWPAQQAPRLLLNHDPSSFAALPDDCADLVLSGHTHGGHIGIQLSPGHAITVVGLAGIPDQGVFRRGDLRLFVTRCVGFYGYPMRVGIPPEIALLVLRAPTAV